MRRTETPALLRPLAALVAVVLLAAVLVVARGPLAADAADTLLSKGRPVTASSSQAGYAAAAAVDGSLTTRWASDWSDRQWIRVDLGRTAKLSRIELRWEAAAAKSYRLQVSKDGKAWTMVSRTTSGRGGNVSAAVTASARYVRMLADARTTSYGYSLWEFRVWGTAPATSTPKPTSTPTPTGTPTPTSTPTPTGTPTPSPTPTPTTGVHVTGTPGHWQLTVDGAPWLVRGVTYGPPAGQASTYLPDIARMGANTIRTWGTDGSSAQLFDAARANGIRVVAGLWLDQGVDYVDDSAYKTKTLASIRSTVATYRSHRGLLMWDVGNEVMLGRDEAQRVAYARYVEQVTRAIHDVDPDHPVTSTDAWTGAWDYYARYTPSLDLYAVNTYGGISAVPRNWTAGGYTKPYVVTETGPAGSWEVPADANGIPRQPSDTAAAQAYTDAWKTVTSHAGVALGATMFHYGVEDDEPGVWLNLRTGGAKRLSWYAVERASRGTVDANTPPVTGDPTTSAPTSGVAPGAAVTISAPAVDPDGDTVSYRVAATSRYVDGDGTMRPLPVAVTGPGTLRIAAPSRAGVWKLAVYADDGHGNVGIGTVSIRVR